MADRPRLRGAPPAERRPGGRGRAGPRGPPAAHRDPHRRPRLWPLPWPKPRAVVARRQRPPLRLPLSRGGTPRVAAARGRTLPPQPHGRRVLQQPLARPGAAERGGIPETAGGIVNAGSGATPRLVWGCRALLARSRSPSMLLALSITDFSVA